MNKEKLNGVKLLSQDLKIDAQFYKQLLDETSTYIFVKNTKGEYVYVNKLTQELFGRDLEDILGYDDRHFFQLDDNSDLIKNDQKVLESGVTVINKEHNVIKATNEVRVYKSVKTPIYNSHNEIIGLLGVSTDITEIYNLKEKLKQLTYTDDLTQTCNRKSYNEKIKNLLSLHNRYGTKFSLILFDIDDFKKINDTFGHQTGDAVLIELCQLIKPHIRQTDALFRIGGEEFAILLPDTSLKQATIMAENIRNLIETELKTIKDKKTTISIGVAEVKEGDNESTLFSRADKLLYQSKKCGKNKVSA